MPATFVSEGGAGFGDGSGDRPSGVSLSPLLRRPQVLLVEDNVALARTLRWAVLAQCEVTTVGTAGEAIECLERAWDAFIFDVTLPDGCGLATLSKARDLHPGAGALVISGGDRDEDIEAARAMGAQYLAKPFTPADILRFLEACLPQRPQSGLVASPFPPAVAKLVVAVKVSGVHAVTAESEHAYRLALLARAIRAAGLPTVSIEACAKGADVARPTLQEFVTLNARWEPEQVAELLSTTDRYGRPITMTILLRIARGPSSVRREFDERRARGELDLASLLPGLGPRRKPSRSRSEMSLKRASGPEGKSQ